MIYKDVHYITHISESRSRPCAHIIHKCMLKCVKIYRLYGWFALKRTGLRVGNGWVIASGWKALYLLYASMPALGSFYEKTLNDIFNITIFRMCGSAWDRKGCLYIEKVRPLKGPAWWAEEGYLLGVDTNVSHPLATNRMTDVYQISRMTWTYVWALYKKKMLMLFASCQRLCLKRR